MAAVDATELELFGIYDRGVPNRERIVLRAHRPVDLSNYALLLGIRGKHGSIVPAPDQFQWLGATRVEGPAWVFVYTGPGQPTVTLETTTKEPAHSIYWNKPSVIFTDPQLIAALVYMSPVQIWAKDKTLADLQQQGAEEQRNYYQEALLKAIEDRAATLNSSSTPPANAFLKYLRSAEEVAKGDQSILSSELIRALREFETKKHEDKK